jgi:CPA1 family monovalent cation:H+ antiporter
MGRLDVAIALLFVIVPLVALARRINVAYPIVLVVSGLALGFVPGLPVIPLSPDVVLLLFLPPLLYWEALQAPVRAMRENSGVVRSLVFGLVIATTTAVAVVAHAIVPHLPWPVAFVIGAVVSPTDAVAFAPVAERIGVPTRTIAVIEAEGLLNDATALIIYASAVAAVASGTFSLRMTALAFVGSAIASVAFGLAVGVLITFVWRRLRDTDLQTAISIVAPFIAYLPAHAWGISGVLAVVTASLYVNRIAIGSMTAEARRRAIGFGQTVTFVMNTAIFLLVGLQLHPVLAALSVYSRKSLVLMALAISATVVAVRFVWIFGQRAIFGARTRIADHPDDEWKMRLIASWAGFRGGVSLAAALAIPTVVAGGADFPRRQLTIFLTYGVILVTLVGQGLTFPALLTWLRIGRDDREARETRTALAHMARVALVRLDELERERTSGSRDALDVLRRRYALKAQRYEETPRHEELDDARIYHAAARELLAVQRTELVRLQNAGTLDSTVCARVVSMLDLEELDLETIAALDDREIAPA